MKKSELRRGEAIIQSELAKRSHEIALEKANAEREATSSGVEAYDYPKALGTIYNTKWIFQNEAHAM
jgi:hypothetical protein